MNIEEVLSKSNSTVRYGVLLSKTTWFCVGGAAEYVVKPRSVKDLAFIIKNKPSNLEVNVIGFGSNIIVRDKGVDGVVIRFGKEFSNISIKNNLLEVEAGVSNSNLIKFCLDNELTGAEFLSGIPGGIGGAMAMNAGAHGKDISDILVKAELVSPEGTEYILDNKDIGYFYRGNNLPKGWIFTKGFFKIEKGTKQQINETILSIKRQREATQPIKSKTGGSTFKNHQAIKAWELIDKAGCRGLRIGDAAVSKKHCNFLLNLGNASAYDLERLGNVVQQKVLEKTGYKLDWEIKIIGKM